MSGLLDIRIKGVTIFRGEVGIPFLMIHMTAIGHLYLFDCKVQPYIPIFLLVGGYMSILDFMLKVGVKFYWEEDNCNRLPKAVQFWYYLISVFALAWWITGSVWVYSVKKVDYEDVTSVEYCNKTLYLYSSWILTISWSLAAIILVRFVYGLWVCRSWLFR